MYVYILIFLKIALKKVNLSFKGRNFPGGPVVKTSLSNAEDTGLVPGQEAKIPHAS